MSEEKPIVADTGVRFVVRECGDCCGVVIERWLTKPVIQQDDRDVFTDLDDLYGDDSKYEEPASVIDIPRHIAQRVIDRMQEILDA